MEGFRNKFEKYFIGLAQRFGLTVSELSDNEIVLREEDFALLVYCDRDGVGVNYLWNSDSGELLQYPVGEILHLLKREWVPSSKPERIEAELEAYAATLQKSGIDLLMGESGWIKKINISPFPVAKSTCEKIGM